jgi:hypothetical protein
LSRHGEHLAREAARIASKTEFQIELTRLRVLHRSTIHAARIMLGGAGVDWSSDARAVRRWMRPVRREIRKAARRP